VNKEETRNTMVLMKIMGVKDFVKIKYFLVIFVKTLVFVVLKATKLK